MTKLKRAVRLLRLVPLGMWLRLDAMRLSLRAIAICDQNAAKLEDLRATYEAKLEDLRAEHERSVVEHATELARRIIAKVVADHEDNAAEGGDAGAEGGAR